jgi:hypothetical protein
VTQWSDLAILVPAAGPEPVMLSMLAIAFTGLVGWMSPPSALAIDQPTGARWNPLDLKLT